MNTTKTIAALFDFDGVIMDTETQISAAGLRDRHYCKSMKSISRTNPKPSLK